jgi:hypothetical protein
LGTTKFWLAATVAAMIVMSPLMARDFGTAGGFDISAQESDAEKPNSGFCGMLEEYEGSGDTRLLLFRYLSNPDMIVVVVDNYNWSIKEGEEHEVEYRLGGSYYDRKAVGTEDSIRKGLMSAFPASEFLPLFAKSSNFKVTKGDVTVDSLSLKGSGAAVEAFDRCWTYLRGDEAAKQRERDRFSHIPKDPFK